MNGFAPKGLTLVGIVIFFDVVDAGMPLVSMAGMGLERFLSLVLTDTVAADFAVSPRYKNGRVFLMRRKNDCLLEVPGISFVSCAKAGG